jgi:hypothetical protein
LQPRCIKIVSAPGLSVLPRERMEIMNNQVW